MTHIFPDSRQCLNCETWHTHSCVVRHDSQLTHQTYIRRDMTHIFPDSRQCLNCETWHTHSYVVRHDSQLTHQLILGETWLLHFRINGSVSVVRHDTLIHMRHGSQFTHKLILGETWLIFFRINGSVSGVRHDTLIHMWWDMTHNSRTNLYSARRDSYLPGFTAVPQLWDVTYEWVCHVSQMQHAYIHTSRHMNESVSFAGHDTLIHMWWDMTHNSRTNLY